MTTSRLFPSFFLGGFECSTHRRPDQQRVDVLTGSQHDRFALQDLERLRALGIKAVREGARWHLIESESGHFDWKSLLPQLQAARQTGVQVVWDVWHYGWPDFLDIWSNDFVRHFERFTREMAHVVKNEMDGPYWFTPVNEPSFYAWAGATKGFFPPYVIGRGPELKLQLMASAIAACQALKAEIPDVRLLHTDPVIRVHMRPERPGDVDVVARYNEGQFEAWDMVGGYRHPELGGAPEFLDVLGVNYYSNNQWLHPDGEFLMPGDERHLASRFLLEGAWNRYGRPLIIAETGTENEARAGWLRYVMREVRGAMQLGVPLGGVCLYPICNHPGWDDDRHCHNGLLDYADENGYRESYQPLEAELHHQARLMDEFDAASFEQRAKIVEAETNETQRAADLLVV